MNAMSLFKKVLGKDWATLPEVIRQHYQLMPDRQGQNTVTGTMTVWFPWYITPLVKFIRLFGGLIDLRGDNLSVAVTKRVNPSQPDCLFWRREIVAPDGSTTVFASRMDYRGEHEITERIGYGFGLNLKVSVEDGKLVYRSNGHLWRIGGLKIPVPDVLVLGHATITETAVSDNAFALDFIIEHPVFGVTYRYGGIFKLHNK